jgi:long-chain fatty acid transport protein
MTAYFTWRQASLATLVLVAAGTAQATNGYFPHGFGLKAKGMGGASVAMAHDGFAGVNNPAASAFTGNRWDLGGEIFMPERATSGFGPAEVKSGREAFLIPEFGYNVKLSEKLGVGLTVYGNGGMNTSYATNVFGGAGKLGVDLMQLIIAPTVAYKVAPGHSFGVSPLLVMQRFEAYGLNGFAPFSSNPAALTNKGKDSSTGLGVRLGYMGQLNDVLTVGVSYSPKINMSKFDDYAGLFAGGGDFDIPENYAVGVALQVTPRVQVALDYQAINYSKVPSIGNASVANLFAGNALGTANGAGFGWKDVNVLKIGVQWQLNAKWVLRAGYNDGDNPVTPADAMFNVLAPGVMEKHITVGGTYQPNAKDEWSFAYWHAKNSTVNGLGFNFTTMPPGTFPISIRMKQNGIGVQYSRKF